MELRRTLLLFAIVLGLAAIASSVSRGGDEDSEPPPAAERQPAPSGSPSAPSASARPAGGALELTFPAAARPRTRRLEPGRPATLIVETAEPGQVEIEGLGLLGYAEPLTPARFEVLTDEEGEYPLLLTPAEGGETDRLGLLEVTD